MIVEATLIVGVRHADRLSGSVDSTRHARGVAGKMTQVGHCAVAVGEGLEVKRAIMKNYFRAGVADHQALVVDRERLTGVATAAWVQDTEIGHRTPAVNKGVSA